MSAARAWNADVYHRVSQPHTEWAGAILDRLALRGDETVLDAGCGSGRVTQQLLERLPAGRVIAVDSSAQMLARAREELDPARADVREADVAHLRLAAAERVDAVFSNAVFHWIADHEALFAALAQALVPGGRLSAQCGGAGNVAAVHEAALAGAADAGLAARFEDWGGPWNFATPDETEARLLAAGFDEARCWLQTWPVEVDDPRTYLQTVCLGPHLERLEDHEQEGFLDAVMTRLGEAPVLDYVRLNIVATRGTVDL